MAAEVVSEDNAKNTMVGKWMRQSLKKQMKTKFIEEIKVKIMWVCYEKETWKLANLIGNTSV